MNWENLIHLSYLRKHHFHAMNLSNKFQVNNQSVDCFILTYNFFVNCVYFKKKEKLVRNQIRVINTAYFSTKNYSCRNSKSTQIKSILLLYQLWISINEIVICFTKTHDYILKIEFWMLKYILPTSKCESRKVEKMCSYFSFSFGYKNRCYHSHLIVGTYTIRCRF